MNGSIRFSGINLFGEFGRNPVFKFYSTDEINVLVSYTRETDAALIPLSDMLGVSSLIALTKKDGTGLTLKQSFSLTEADAHVWKTENELIWLWRHSSPALPELAFITEESLRKAFLENRETLYLSYSATTRTVIKKALYGTLGHRTDLVLSEKGKLSAFLKLGLGTEYSGGISESGSGERLYAGGISFGIEGELKF